MRIDGKWMTSDSGAVLPVIVGAVVDDQGTAHPIPFLVDTGAEQTVFNYEAVALVGAEQPLPQGFRLEGIGGTIPSVAVTTTIWFLTTSGQPVPFNGQFGGIADPAVRGMSILGRDVFRELALVVDRQGGVVCLLHGRHRYVIQES